MDPGNHSQHLQHESSRRQEPRPPRPLLEPHLSTANRSARLRHERSPRRRLTSASMPASAPPSLSTSNRSPPSLQRLGLVTVVTVPVIHRRHTGLGAVENLAHQQPAPPHARYLRRSGLRCWARLLPPAKLAQEATRSTQCGAGRDSSLVGLCGTCSLCTLQTESPVHRGRAGCS